MATSLVPSAMVSMVSNLEFFIASIIKMFRTSSFKLDPQGLSCDPNAALVDLIPKFDS